MSRYEWPQAGRRETEDDAGGRLRFTSQFKREFDAEGAHQAARKALVHHATPGAKGARSAKAPVSGNSFLWQPLGPMTVTNGQIIGAGRIAGRINMLAVHSAGERVYAASGNGGVWYSNNGGQAWVALGGFATTPIAGINRPVHRNACGCIEVAFGGTEATDKVFVGTGETVPPFDAQPGTSAGGVGILVADHPATTGGDDPWIREAKNLVGEGVCRIAVQPGGTGVVAATTIGLFQRPASPGPDCNWDKVQLQPFKDISDKCSEVIWTKGDATRPERLWVWIQDGPKAGLWCRNITANGAFEQILVLTALGNGSFPRGQLARVDPATVPSQMYAIRDLGGANAQVFRIRCPDGNKPAADSLVGVPAIMGSSGQGFYDIVVATHPTLPDRVVLGGCSFPAAAPPGSGTPPLASGNTDDGAVVIADVAQNGANWTFGHPNPFVQVGVGVHSDVHDVVWTNAGARMFVACDGGVFRSDQPMKPFSFYAANNGLAVIEANFLACHPTCEGFIVAGLQDNGIIVRRSSALWNHEGDGDGGGVVLDPLQPDRYFRQYFNAVWEAVPGPAGGLPITQAESDNSAFYADAAVIAKKRGATDVRQLVVGTRRVFYSEDFGSNWVTLPSCTVDTTAAGNTAIDSFGQQIIVLRWQSSEVLWVLGRTKLARYERTADTATGPGTWTNPAKVMRPPDPVVPGGKEKKRPPVPPSMNDTPVMTDIAPNLDAGGVQHGTLGALYIGTVGHPTKTEVDTLWWFDGTDKWFPTKLRTDPNGVPAPVTAIACHPDFPLEVWVGTTVGVWHGVRTDHGADPPTWAWTGHVNGLPEAEVEDLEIFKDGTLMLLRAGIAARGIWELRWDTPTLVPKTYVRAHDDDLRHRDHAVPKKRDLKTDRSWHASPDVRPRRAPVSVPPPATLPWYDGHAAIDAEQLRRFQSALRSFKNDPRVQPTGGWGVSFNEVLRDLGAPIAPALPPPPLPPNTPPPGAVIIDSTFWNQSMAGAHATREPWGIGLPTEADLVDYALKLEEGDIGQAKCTLARTAHKVDVMVHHRGGFAVGGTTVHVTLLKWVDPAPTNAAKWNDVATWAPADTPPVAAINEVLNSVDGKTAIALPTGWSFVLGGAGDSHRVTLTGQMVDSTHPGIATFDLDLATATNDSLMILLAVIREGAPQSALAVAPLKTLAFDNPTVAIRALHVLS